MPEEVNQCEGKVPAPWSESVMAAYRQEIEVLWHRLEMARAENARLVGEMQALRAGLTATQKANNDYLEANRRLQKQIREMREREALVTASGGVRGVRVARGARDGAAAAEVAAPGRHPGRRSVWQCGCQGLVGGGGSPRRPSRGHGS